MGHKSQKRAEQRDRDIINKKVRKQKFVEEKHSLFNPPPLCEEQQQALDKILDDNTVITILKGFAGSGKSFLAAAAAMKLLSDGKIDKIYITKSCASTESLGYLPGDVNDKMSGFVMAIMSCFFKVYSREHVEAFFNEGKIEIMPIQHMRGITVDNREVLIVDEAQNMTTHQLKLILTRVGVGGRIIATGDDSQIDLKSKDESGLSKVAKFKINGLEIITLTEEHRSQIVIDLINEFEKIGL